MSCDGKQTQGVIDFTVVLLVLCRHRNVIRICARLSDGSERLGQAERGRVKRCDLRSGGEEVTISGSAQCKLERA
jgi:hypothetical protein